MPRTLVILLATLTLTACGGGNGSSESDREDQGGPSPANPLDMEGNGSSPDSPAWFVDITSDIGIDFTRRAGAAGGFYIPEVMGGGVATFDADGDGDLDLYFTQASDDLPTPTGEGGWQNQLYLRQDDGRYVNATEGSGLGDRGYGNGVATGDFDNDGDVDVFVTNCTASRLYRNRGDGTFEDATVTAQAAVTGWSTSAAFVDYDADGWLDLYVCRYVDYTSDKVCTRRSGEREYCGPLEYEPVSDVLLHNRGDGTFEDVSERTGIATARCAGLGVVCADLDEDGRVDIYVANDAYANQLWRQREDGTFEDTALFAGAAFNMMGEPEAGMGVLAADFDRDGRLDLFMTHLENESNTLYRNEGNGIFVDDTGPSGLGDSMQFTGFGTLAFDVDLDGYVDLFVANGRVLARPRPMPGAIPAAPWDAYAEPNLLYRNRGGARIGFEAVGEVAAALCAPVEITRAAAAADLDADGDLDLILVNLEGGARVYRNDAPREGDWLVVRALNEHGSEAIGAEVRLRTTAGTQLRLIGGAFSYQSASDGAAHFGLGREAEIESLEVRWPDGTRESLDPPATNTVVTIQRGQA